MRRVFHAFPLALALSGSSACSGARGAAQVPGAPDAPNDASGAGDAATSGAGGGAEATTSGTGGMAPSITGCEAGGASGQGGAATSIDYALWQLQLPIGAVNAPTTISAQQLLAGFSDDYFYLAPDGGRLFMDPETGVTTSGSAHCRSELRELAADGSPAAWGASGSHSLTVSGQVLQVGGGASGLVTVGQLFDGTDSIPLMELQYSSKIGGFQLLYEEAKGAGSTLDLARRVALSTPYRFTLSLAGCTASVAINDQTVFTRAPSAAVLAKTFYFKFGAYDQTSTSGSPTSVPYTIVEAYAAEVVHR